MKSKTIKWYTVCPVVDVPKRGAVRLSHGDTQIAIFKTASDELFALEDKCPHKGGPLSSGIIHDDCVTCPLHNWDISLKSGQALGADEGGTRVFPTQVKDEKVLICIDEVHSELSL